jgi:hypothetical protein
MKLARKIIAIIEGFKLGALGAGHSRNLRPSASDINDDEPNIAPWNFKPTSFGFKWFEYVKSEWTQLFGVSHLDGKVQMIVVVELEHVDQISQAAVVLNLSVYHAKNPDSLELGSGISSRGFVYKDFFTDDDSAHEWIIKQQNKIHRNGLIALDFPDSWRDISHINPKSPAPPASHKTAGRILSVTKKSGGRLIVHNPNNSFDPDFLHSQDRVNTMTAKKLLTRLGRITKPQKLLDTAIALESSNDPDKQAVAVQYFDRLESVYGYTVERA